ncbi:MAG: hypothetical protein CMD14_02350 [Flavobacteriales bacterium]|nr:hypothetical protein [Flavobacteriales bacterium]
MAIDTGLGVVCADLQATGGITQILIREWVTADVITYGAGTAHTITNIQSGGSDAAWFVYEFKNEVPALTISATKENGSTAFECGLSFMLPNIDATKFEELKNFENACMMALVNDTNGNWWTLGVSSKYKNEDVAAKSQTFMSLTGFEGGTGAAYSDENDITVNMMSRQFELPRTYAGTVTVDTSALTATTGA